MEEILNKISELEQFSDRKNELNAKQADIKGKKEDLKKLKEKRSMNISPITSPVLDEQIQGLESEIEGLDKTYKDEAQVAREEFSSIKEELRKLIERQKSLYKRKDSLDQEKAKDLKDLAEQRKKAEEEFAKRNEDLNKKVAEESNKRRIYQRILDDAIATHENMVKAFSEGKNVDQTNVKSVLDEITANKKKVEDIEFKISGMKEAFENDKQARMAELDDYEDRINNYKAIEDNMDEIDDLEHLSMSLNSFTFDNIDVLKSNPVVASLKQREQQKAPKQQQEEDSIEPKSDGDAGTKLPDDTQSSNDEKSEAETEEKDEQYDLDREEALNSLDRTDMGMDYGSDDDERQEKPKEEQSPKDTGKIGNINVSGITIKDGIIVRIEKNGEPSEIKIDLKHANKNYRMTENEKFELLKEMIGDNGYFIDYDIDEAIEKADPNVIFGLNVALESVPVEVVEEKAKAYLNALKGDKVAKEVMKGFITYDMREKSRFSRFNLIKRIKNYRYFKGVKRYVGNAKDMATIIQDKASKGLKGLLGRKDIKLLNAGKEKIEGVTQNLKAKADDVKDSLGDTAAKGKIRMEAFKKGYQVYQQEYEKESTKLDNEGVPQIPTGSDRRTKEEKDEDEGAR